MLSVLLVTVVRTQAGTITLADVAHAFVDGQQRRPGAELRVRSVAQNGAVPLSGVADLRLAQSGNNQSSNTQTGTQSGTQSTPTTTTTGSGSIVDAAQQQQQQGGTVETVDLGDVTGTVCDCGEIPVPPVRGGFPLWPLLALAGIPLAFLPGDDDEIIPPPIDTPPPAIPEPATILLLGTSLMALGAGARRRSRKTSAAVATPAEEV